MRALLWILGLFAAAIGLVMAARYNHGYVLLVLAPWRAELSFNFALLLALTLFFLGYILLRIVSATLSTPARVRT